MVSEYMLGRCGFSDERIMCSKAQRPCQLLGPRLQCITLRSKLRGVRVQQRGRGGVHGCVLTAELAQSIEHCTDPPLAYDALHCNCHNWMMIALLC